MINIKNEFIRDVLPKIGSDAFSVFMAIASHAGRGTVVWPGTERLRNMCTVEKAGEIGPMPEKRFYKAVKKLIEFNLAARFQERKGNGDFGKRKFKIMSDLVGVTMWGEHEFEGDDLQLLGESPRLVKNGLAPNDQTEELPKEEHNVQIKDVALQSDFVFFWNLFGNKKNKKKAQSAFNRLSKAKKKLCIEAIVDYKKYLDHTGIAQMHPTTWINGERWNDDFEVKQKGANTDQALNAHLLSEENEAAYNRYIQYVIEEMPALWKSNCKILSKSEWLEMQQGTCFKNLFIHLTPRKQADIRRKLHHIFNDLGYERNKYSRIYDAIKEEYSCHINDKKRLVA